MPPPAPCRKRDSFFAPLALCYCLFLLLLFLVVAWRAWKGIAGFLPLDSFATKGLSAHPACSCGLLVLPPICASPIVGPFASPLIGLTLGKGREILL